jgi:hypothetical protein
VDALVQAFMEAWAEYTFHDTLPRDPALHGFMYQMAKAFFSAGWMAALAHQKLEK